MMELSTKESMIYKDNSIIVNGYGVCNTSGNTEVLYCNVEYGNNVKYIKHCSISNGKAVHWNEIIRRFNSVATPGFQNIFDSRIKIYFVCTARIVRGYKCKNYFIPPSHGDVYFKYSFAFKKPSRKIADCYTTYTFN